MPTWRERVVAARERGEFSSEDYRLWSNQDTCPAGEIVFPILGLQYAAIPSNSPWEAIFDGPGWQFQEAMRNRDFDRCERIIAEMEDMALQFKREPTS